MEVSRRQFAALMSLLGASAIVGSVEAGDDKLILKGRLVSLDEIISREFNVTLESERRGVILCLRTAEGKSYPILPTDTASAFWDDEHYRQRDLLLTVRSFLNLPFVEIIKTQSVKWGRVYDMYFYCIVCNIKTHKPGPCECCQDPLVFTESLAE